MKQAHLFISGSVQGVGFRYFVRLQANALQLCGFVRNLPDGRVEIVVQGSKKNIEALMTKCLTGPEASQVEMVNVTWEKVTAHFDEFDVK